MKPLTIHDYKVIKPFLDIANYEGYFYHFVTMIMWNHEFHICYEIHDHFLVLLCYENNEYYWMMPCCEKGFYHDAIEYMIDYSSKNRFLFSLKNASLEFINEIKKQYGSYFLYKRNKNNDEYIYDKEMHKTLKGKKIQKRRNHFNNFKKLYPSYQYKELNTVNDFNSIISCVSKWRLEKDSLSKSITSEVYGMMTLFSYSNELDYKVGGIYIDNQLEGFIIGHCLDNQTIHILVEKANKNMRGLYPALFKEFLDHHYENAIYVNREEDMGLENLRRAKLSLYPIKMVEKYDITLNTLSLHHPLKSDKDEIMRIWNTYFDDENEESTNYYFSAYYKEENTYICKNNNIIIAGMQIVPFELFINNNIEIHYFILGVFTVKEYQSQGIMKSMLNEVLNSKKYKNKTIHLQAYQPTIYKSLGFEPSYYQYMIKPDINYYKQFDLDDISDDIKDMRDIYDQFVSQYKEYRIRNDAYFMKLKGRTKGFNEEIIIFSYQNKVDGYVICTNKEDLFVSEIIYLSDLGLKRMIRTLIQFNHNIILYVDLKTKAKIQGTKMNEIIHMLSNKKSIIENEDKYINECY